ncbi:MAG: patatin-like phospholipase family protein [Bacteroidota bacterium]
MRRTFLFFLLALLSGPWSRAQKVGLVLSGGGASGLAHIGVIKAMEEDSIPIDYITGTSIGALVGAMYAAGYSPAQMEQLATSEQFQNWAYGKIDDKYVYYFKKKEDNASWISFKLSLDSIIETSLPTNLVSPVAIDFALMETMSGAIAAAGYQFDSLFVPFRCLASDIEAKRSVIFKEGDLATALRASMAYPFYLRPMLVDGKLLFDGGIYNNFPANVMYDDFFPDIIIGSNVSNNEPPPNEESLLSQMKTMLLTKTNFDVICQNGIIIEPAVNNIGTFDFGNVQVLIDSGYASAKRKIAQMKTCIERRTTPEMLKQKRAAFQKKQPPLVFDNITVSGVSRNQAKYIGRLLSRKSEQTSVARLKPEYFKLAADDKIKHIYPSARFNPQSGYYDLHLRIKREKDFVTQIGGNFSNRPISVGFLAVQYNYLGAVSGDISGNAYFGKLYASGQIRARLNIPYKIPFYIEGNYTNSRWDFFKSSAEFVTDVKPSFLVQYEQYLYGDIGFPVGNKGKLVTGTGLAWLTDEYYQTDQFTQQDTADLTDFNLYTAYAYYEKNSLNRKQYASQGSYFNVRLRYVQGEEDFTPGTTSLDSIGFRKIHEWLVLKLVYEKYFKSRKFYKAGIYFEGVYSAQTLFNNFTSSILSAPAFQPLPESKTLFQEKFRAHKYLAIGIKQVFSIRSFLDLRLEGFAYEPYQRIIRGPGLTADYTTPFLETFFIGTAALVVHTPLGPASVGANYYYGEDEPFTFLFHFGYIIFNKKALD